MSKNRSQRSYYATKQSPPRYRPFVNITRLIELPCQRCYLNVLVLIDLNLLSEDKAGRGPTIMFDQHMGHGKFLSDAGFCPHARCSPR
jgi:hypothetical protein